MSAFLVIGLATTIESQDKAPALERPEPQSPPAVESQEKTSAPAVQSPDKTSAPTVESPDKASTPRPESPDKTSAPKVVGPDKTPIPSVGSQDQKPAAAPEVVVYASDLSANALSEFEFWPSRVSPGGKMLGTPQTGDKMNPPPEEDPHVIFKVRVQSGVPYRCWIRMRVGAPMGISQANRLYVQISDAVDKSNKDAFRPNTGSYLTAQGPVRQGWKWVACEAGPNSTESLIYFRTSREVSVRLQAGMEGVGFDQFVLSPAQFLERPPAEAVVKK